MIAEQQQVAQLTMQIDKNKEDMSSKKTKSYHKANKSDHNNKPNVQKREQMMVFVVNRSSKQERSQRNYSDKCSSDVQYRHAEERANTNRDIDGKTEINNNIINTKNQELEEELEQQELVREGVVKPSQKKIKIGSRKRQVISHDILHPPINISAKKQKKQVRQPNESQRRQQQQYEEIAHNVRLDNLHSKIVETPSSTKREETFLAKINESQSQVISSPLNNQKLAIIQSPLRPKIESQQLQMFKKSESINKMGSIEQQGINQSVERTLKQKQVIEDRKINRISDRIPFCESEQQFQKLTQKKSNKVQQNPIFISNKPDSSKINKLTLVPATVEQKLKLALNSQDEDNKKLNEEISLLKQAVRELRLQKIKARAEFSTSIDHIPFSTQKKNRYETLNTISDRKSDAEEVGHYKFGKIRKNRSLSRKKVYSIRSNQLSIQKQLDLPDPIINIKKLPQKIKFDTFLTERKHVEEQKREYRTMDLGRIAEQNMEESFKYQGNLATSMDMPVYGSNFRSNKISMRGPEICNQVLNKFESNDRKFRDFVNVSSSSKNKTQNSRVQSNGRATESSNQSSFGGTIVKNNFVSKPSTSSNRIIDLKSISLIRQAEKITVKKANKDFTITSIPQVPNNPVYSTPTQEIMDLILKVLPYSNLKYTSQDLQDCILKKFKNCIMFQLKRFPLTKLVWYFNGKLYIGQWDEKKNQKIGFGKEFSKGKNYFQGNFKDNKKNGKGSFVSQAYLYQGQWINGEKEGHGKYINSAEGIYYEGQWVKGKKDGKGHFQFEGNIFQGIFEQDVKQGFGIQFFKNGDRFIGTYENGKFQGEGKYIWFNGSFYLGHFREGFRQGSGKWQSALENYELYMGEFHRDKKQGNGKYVWNNRCVYQGNFFNDLKHGLGSMLYPDGRFVEGIWTQGILTEILSKVAQANKEQPLDQPKSRTLQSRTIIRVVDRY